MKYHSSLQLNNHNSNRTTLIYHHCNPDLPHITMSTSTKRPARVKRKISSEDLTDDSSSSSLLNLSSSKTTPKVIAQSLLSLLPNEATKQHDDAKKLAKAFPLVIAELEARSALQARRSGLYCLCLSFVILFALKIPYTFYITSLPFRVHRLIAAHSIPFRQRHHNQHSRGVFC